MDGRERLWGACKTIYCDIDSLRLNSEFQISPGRRFAFTNGGKHLVNSGDTNDFHWLVHVRLNFLKFRFHGSLNVNFSRLLDSYKSKLTNDIYWGIIQLHAISTTILNISKHDANYIQQSYIYLQSLADGNLDVAQSTISCKLEAREILSKSNQVWIGEIGNECNSKFKIIFHTILPFAAIMSCYFFEEIELSPDNKLLACMRLMQLHVLNLPSLTNIFSLNLSIGSSKLCVFSPDSTYLLCNSIRSCICIKEQKEVPFIPDAPESISSCSFTSDGVTLITLGADSIQMWDVRTKHLLMEVKNSFDSTCRLLGNCQLWILERWQG